MSQKQLAEKWNVSIQAITKWETGLGISDIENIAILFHVSLDELLLSIEETTNDHQNILYILDKQENLLCHL